MNKIVMKTKDLCKSFSTDGEQNHILNNINMELYEGEFTVIMGPSGSGKSTLLYSLSGMDKPTSGEVLYDDKDIGRFKEKELSRLRNNDFGFVFQQMHLINNLSLFENVAVPGYLNKKNTAKEVDDRALELLKDMNLEKQIKRLPSRTSGGEQQRCAIARAVINSPKLLFADEPTGALNRKNSNDVLDMFTLLNRKGQSILMVTHDMKAALRADRILYLVDGDIVGELRLNKYNEDDVASRETQVNAWLTSYIW